MVAALLKHLATKLSTSSEANAMTHFRLIMPQRIIASLANDFKNTRVEQLAVNWRIRANNFYKA